MYANPKYVQPIVLQIYIKYKDQRREWECELSQCPAEGRCSKNAEDMYSRAYPQRIWMIHALPVFTIVFLWFLCSRYPLLFCESLCLCLVFLRLRYSFRTYVNSIFTSLWQIPIHQRLLCGRRKNTGFTFRDYPPSQNEWLIDGPAQPGPLRIQRRRPRLKLVFSLRGRSCFPFLPALQGACEQEL